MASDHDVFSEALALPLEERARLAHRLIVSLDEQHDEGSDEAWAAEIERRLKEIDDGTVALSDWAAVRDRIASRLRSQKR